MSVARVHLMDKRSLRPDPIDYQIIAFANCLQLISCLCQIAALAFEGLEQAAEAIECVADAVSCSVAGCMGAQIHHELNQPNTAQVAPSGGVMVRG